MLDSIDEIIEKIALGEDSTVEFKQEIPYRDRSSLADEISAFANSKGGVILFGVADDGVITGIQNELDAAESMVIELCRDSIEPEVLVFTEKLIIDKKHVLKVEINRSLFVHRSPNGYFARQGSSKREIPTEQLARLLQSRSQARVIRFDEQLVPNTNKESLRNDLFDRFLKRIPIKTEGEKEAYLEKLGLLVREGEMLRASVAGILMCSARPDEYLYNSFIDAVCYKGVTKDANYQLDGKKFKGPLDQQILDAYKFVEKYNAVSARKDVGRVERPEYNMRAVFEALVNAVVHRDYSKQGSKIRLFLFAGRLELYSPGDLANTLTVDSLPHRQVTRNELLARLLSDLEIDVMEYQVGRRYFLERRGEGVGIIIKESEELSGKTPLYEMHDEELCLTIFAADSLQK